MIYNYYTKRLCNSLCHIYEFDPRKLRYDVTLGIQGKLETLSSIYGEPNENEVPVGKINCGFFSSNKSENIGSFVDEGKYYRGSEDIYPTVIFWKDYTLRPEFAPTQTRHITYQQKAFWAVACSWTLVQNGKINYQYDKNKIATWFAHATTKNPRTLVGQKNDGTIIWCVVDGRKTSSPGVTMEQSAEIMLSLGCEYAYNHDGGGSSEMIVLNKIVNTPSDGKERNIGSAMMTYCDASKYIITGNITASNLNVRTTPINGTVIGKLVKNTKVIITGSKNGWYRINYNDKIGYLSPLYTSLISISEKNTTTPITTPPSTTDPNNNTSDTQDQTTITIDKLKSMGINKIIF